MFDQLTLFERLGVFVVRDFLDRQLCEQILAATRQAQKIDLGGVVNDKGESVVDETLRKVQQTQLSQSIVETVGHKLRAIAPQLEAKFQVKLVDCQGLNFLFYREGDFYSPHQDRNFNENYQHINQRRRVSVVIFVNGEEQMEKSDSSGLDTYKGGELMFYGLFKNEKANKLGLSLNGQPGLFVAFESDLMHEVKPVTAGERLTIVSWFLGEE